MSIIKVQLHGDSIFTLQNILTPEECLEVIKDATSHGWSESSPSGGGHGRTGREDPRTSQFSVIFKPDLAEKLWKKVLPHLPADLEYLGENVYFNQTTKGTEWKPHCVYDKMRIYKYQPGQNFPEHFDYKVKRSIVTKDSEVVQQSFLSLLVYLNDDFEGGETGYWPNSDHVHIRFKREGEKNQKSHQIKITPVTGTAVIQDQNILHEGLTPRKGDKYLLRTDLIHQRDVHRPEKVKATMKPNVGEWERLFETSCKNYVE